MTNLEGRVLRRQRLMPPPLGVRTDLDVLNALANSARVPYRLRAPSRLRCSPNFGGQPQGAIADYSGIDDARLDSEAGAYWPCPRGTDGTPRMFAETFATPDGRARFIDVDHRPIAEELDAEYPLLSHDRPGAGALPKRHANPPGARPCQGRP